MAPPRTLAELRDKLHSQGHAGAVGEILKDLANHPLGKIERIVRGALKA